MAQAFAMLGMAEIKLPSVSLKAGVLAKRRGLSIFMALAVVVNYFILVASPYSSTPWYSRIMMTEIRITKIKSNTLKVSLRKAPLPPVNP